MKKIKLEGDIAIEVKSQLEKINSIRNSIENLSTAGYINEKKMWNHLRKEFPTLSDNCRLEVNGDEILLTDRLANI